jgi:hypothetical protein
VPRSAFRRTLKIEDVALHRGGRYGTRAEIAALYGSLPGAAAANSRLIDMGGSYDTATKG